MGSLMVVEVEPRVEAMRALAAVAVDAPVGPFAQQGLNEALSLAVGLWCSGLGAQVAQVRRAAGVTKAMGAVARAVVREHPLDRDALLGEPSACAVEESGATGAALVEQDLGIGEAGEVVDSHM